VSGAPSTPQPRADGDLRVLRPERLEEWGSDELVWHVLAPVWDASVAGDPPVHVAVPAGATDGQTWLYAVWWMLREVNTGGFHQLHWSSAGALAGELLEGLLALGAKEYAQLLVESLELLPPGTPDQAARQEALELAPAGKLEGLDLRFHALGGTERLLPLAAAFVRARPGEFFRD
jgi:hypothetical protein